MASVFRTTAVWQNFIGAPGYTKFSWLEVSGQAGADQVTAAMRTFFQSLINALPSGLTVQVQAEVQEHDEASGQLVGELVATALPALVTGTGTGPYAGGSGMFIGWKTGAIWQGRRVQGRTYLVPTVGPFEANGTPTSGAIATLQSAGNALIADAGTVFAVWARQWSAPTTPPTPPTQIGGAAFQVLTAVVRDQASQLRSRRL